MTKKTFKEALIKLGLPVAIATGIVYYFFLARQYMTYEEYIALIETYQAKIEEIKANCEQDERCIEIEGKKVIDFGKVKSKKDVIKKLNKWINESTSR